MRRLALPLAAVVVGGAAFVAGAGQANAAPVHMLTSGTSLAAEANQLPEQVRYRGSGVRFHAFSGHRRFHSSPRFGIYLGTPRYYAYSYNYSSPSCWWSARWHKWVCQSW